MTPSQLRARLLLALGAGGVAAACGGTTGSVVAGGPGDAGADVSAHDAGDSAADGAPDAFADAPNESGADVAVEVGPSLRRPFLVGATLRKSDLVARADWSVEDAAPPPDAGLDAVTARALAEAWARDGCEEHASVAAFARFTLHLLAAGAPPDLVSLSQRASLEEIRHARACFVLARRYGGRAVGPGALRLDGALEVPTLEDMAALAAEEGCVGETIGALLAIEQRALATDPFVSATLEGASLVADEARHAELAWRFVRWAIGQGGAPIALAVERAIARAARGTLAAPLRSLPGVDLGAWKAHGRLTCEQARAVAERGLRDVVEPCARALGLAWSAPRRGPSPAFGQDLARRG